MAEQTKTHVVAGLPIGRIKNLEDTRVIGVNTHKITVSDTAPVNPALYDLWVDIS